MKRLFAPCLVASMFAIPALANEIAPDDVKFEDSGAVAESLTGVPGDPVKGAETAATKSLGNCVACHQVTALSKYEPHGNIGPSLDGAGSRWEESQLRGIVAGAKHTFADTVMPSFYKVSGFIRPGDGYTGKAAPAEIKPILSAQDVEDVVAFLTTLKE